MDIDYREVFEALRVYIDETLREMERRHSSSSNDSWRGFAEGYYLYGTVSEERFLDFCDNLDGELYDDYKEMYESGSSYWGIPLEKYVYSLQKITEKRPEKIRHWNHLRVEEKKKE